MWEDIKNHVIIFLRQETSEKKLVLSISLIV